MKETPIAGNLLTLRRQKGVTQEEVAKALSISNKTLSKWENGVSAPDLPMLVALSKYYGVSTDSLLGLREPKAQDTDAAIAALFEGLGQHAAAIKALEILRAIIPAAFAVYANVPRPGDVEEPFPEEDPTGSRSMIATSDLYALVAKSKNANVAVTLLRNKENFAWLRDEKVQKKITSLFRFLSDTNVLSVLYFVHSTACSENFTVDYVAGNTGVAESHVEKILEEFCAIGACTQRIAHLAEGKVKIYQSRGDGIILSLITLAFEQMCGTSVYDYKLDSNSKMISGGT